jgi:hypothetical protein
MIEEIRLIQLLNQMVEFQEHERDAIARSCIYESLTEEQRLQWPGRDWIWKKDVN